MKRLLTAAALFLLVVTQPVFAALSTQSFGIATLATGTSDCPQQGTTQSTCTFTLTDENGNYAGGSTFATASNSGVLYAAGSAVADGPNSGIYSAASSQATLQDAFTVTSPNFGYAVFTVTFAGDGFGQMDILPFEGLTQSTNTSIECTNAVGSCSSVTLTSNGQDGASFAIYAVAGGGASVLSNGMGTTSSGAFESESLGLSVYDTSGKLIGYTEDDTNIDLPGSVAVSPTPAPPAYISMLLGLGMFGFAFRKRNSQS